MDTMRLGFTPNSVLESSRFPFSFTPTMTDTHGWIMRLPERWRQYVGDQVEEMTVWCAEQFGPNRSPWDDRDGCWYMTSDIIRFAQAEHAVAFKLRWC